MQSVWQLAAKKRWPSAAIKGDGQFAMHAACCVNGTVSLFAFAVEAVQASDRDCGHAFCSRAHAAFQLQPAPQKSGVAYQQTFATYGRD